MDKKKYFTINEVEELFSIPATVIRSWEIKFTLLNPVRFRGRKYYSKDDMDNIKMLKKLIVIDKMSVKEVRKISSRKKASNHLGDEIYSDKESFLSSIEKALSNLNECRQSLLKIL